MDRFYQSLEGRRLLSDNALRFDGVNDFVDMGNPADDHLDLGLDATIEMKVNFKALPAIGSKATFLSKGTAQASWFWGYSREVVLDTDFSGIVFDVETPTGSTSGGFGWIPQLNHWYHIAMVKSGQNSVDYIDGVVQTNGFSNVDPPHAEAPLQVGRAQGQRPFNGMIDEVRMWNTARTATQIAANRNKTLTGTESGLAGYWDFNEGLNSQVALDRTSHHSDGRLGTSTGVDTSDPVRVVLSGGGGTASIAGTLFNDLDADGVRDSGEPPLASWRLWLDADKDGVLDAGEPTALTDSAGNYKFANLAPGSYRVREVTSSGWRRTTPTSGYFDLTLTSGQNVTAKNFGNTQKVSISGSVFNDLDGD